MPVLKQFSQLGKVEFDEHPIWVACHGLDHEQPWYNETNEETFRPWDGRKPVDSSQAMFLVKASFTAADGTILFGFITPVDEYSLRKPDMLGLIQPYVFLPSGQAIALWFGMFKPSERTISDSYSGLGKSLEQLFPLKFTALPGLAKGISSGTIPGFCYLGKDGKVDVKT